MNSIRGILKLSVAAAINIDSEKIKKANLDDTNIFFHPIRSTKTPKKGAPKVPENLKAPNKPSIKGESVVSRINQERIKISINSAECNAISDSHISLYLGTCNDTNN